MKDNFILRNVHVRNVVELQTGLAVSVDISSENTTMPHGFFVKSMAATIRHLFSRRTSVCSTANDHANLRLASNLAAGQRITWESFGGHRAFMTSGPALPLIYALPRQGARDAALSWDLASMANVDNASNERACSSCMSCRCYNWLGWYTASSSPGRRSFDSPLSFTTSHRNQINTPILHASCRGQMV